MTAPAEPHPLPVAEAAVDDLRHAHRDLLRVVDSLSDVDWRRPVPYGEWTVKDLVAHVIGDMSPSGPGLILAGVLTPQFIADTSKGFDVRARNRSLVEERRRFTKEDLRQMLFEAHDAMIAAMLRLQEQHLPVLRYAVPMGPGYELHVEDWLWHGYHDRQHADDIRRALRTDYDPRPLPVLPEIEARFRRLTRYHDGFIRAVYSAAAEAWDERSEACPEWTHREILAHVATNDQRPIARLRAVLGERDEAALAALLETDKWNQEQVDARRARSVGELVDELMANRHQLMLTLSRLKPDHLSANIGLADGSAITVIDYIDRIGEHESMHAGQLVPASRARRWPRG